MTRPEAMEQVTVLLNKARSTRKFAYDMWGEDSAHAIWDAEIALYEYLLAELGDSAGVSGNSVVDVLPTVGDTLPETTVAAAIVSEAEPVRTQSPV